MARAGDVEFWGGNMDQNFSTLTERSFVDAVSRLATLDADLASVIHRHGPPPFWTREPGFPTLTHIILEQQVSLASAKAAFDRLQAATSPLTPESLLALDDDTMRAVGFSRQKTEYARILARHVLDGRLDLARLGDLSNHEATAQLLKLKGIGPWSAQVYLLMALRRSDIWPLGDLALVVAMQEVKQLSQRPSADEMARLAEPWRPCRAVAARILWHHYLSTR